MSSLSDKNTGINTRRHIHIFQVIKLTDSQAVLTDLKHQQNNRTTK